MLATLTRIVVEALQADDPPAALASALERAELDPTERAALAAIDLDGLVLAGRLVKKLRFERLLQGDPTLRAEFHADPVGFLPRFRRWDQERPAWTPWPAEEAREFRSPGSGRPGVC